MLNKYKKKIGYSLFFTLFLVWVIFGGMQCSGRIPRGSQSARKIADQVQTFTVEDFPSCSGAECCAEDRRCLKMCHTIFQFSEEVPRNARPGLGVPTSNLPQYTPPSADEVSRNRAARDRCKVLPKQTVQDLDNLVKGLTVPIIQDLRWIDVSQEFHLLLAIDPYVLIRLVKNYRMDYARELLFWFAEENLVARELLMIEKKHRSELMYELLASAGDRTLPGPVENGLARHVSFNQTFFQLLVRYQNNEMIQITHNMIREDMCRHTYGSGRKIGLCILRIYCREERGIDNQYVHPESIRNNLIFRIEDDELFKYLRTEIYNSSLDQSNLTQLLLDDNVCQRVCNDTYRGCEGYNL